MKFGSILTLIVGAGAVYAALVGLLYVFQRSLLYLPDNTPPDLNRAGVPGLEAVETATGDGLRLLAWFHPAQRGHPTILYFHGNGGHIGHRSARARLFVQAGYGLLLAEYRGYGGNPGRPDEAGLQQDAEAAIAFLGQRGVPPARIVLYGESLGTAVAVKLAADLAVCGTPVAALVLDAPFTSIADVAQHHYPWMPARRLVKDRFDAAARIAAVGAPVLVLHGERDYVVPVAFGRALFALAVEPKRGLFLPDADHVSILDERTFRAVDAFIRESAG